MTAVVASAVRAAYGPWRKQAGVAGELVAARRARPRA